MRKQTLRSIALLLCLMMSLSVPVQAAEPYASAQIAHHSAQLIKGSDGYLNVVYSITANRDMNIIGASSVEIQRYSNSQWITEYTYTMENTPELVYYNYYYYALVLPYYPKYTNASYRALVHLYAESDTMISTVTDTTNTV